MSQETDRETRERIERERGEILAQFQSWLEVPMVILGLGWLALIVADLAGWLTPFLATLANAIWGFFVLEFLAEFLLSPRKLRYLAANWLVALSLLLPALRAVRLFRFLTVLRTLRAVRGLQLLRVLTSVNRGMRALSKSMRRRGFGYVVLLTAIVVFSGAAGMYFFERGADPAMASYGAAVWWTSMMMTTMGSGYWPQTPEGRLLCFLLALYAFSVFGYVTAALATFFVGQDADTDRQKDELREILAELRRLRRELPSKGKSGENGGKGK